MQNIVKHGKPLALSLCETYAVVFIKDTHREKAPSNETPGLTKSMNMNIWVVGTSNQLFRRSSYSETKFSKKIKWLLAKLRPS